MGRATKKEIKTTDALYSKRVRMKYADWRGNVKCFTCEATKPYKEMDAGHYISRRHYSTRFDDRNVHPQCPRCNRFRHGEMDVYALNLRYKYGDDILEILNKEKEKIRDYTSCELKEFRKWLRDEIKKHEKNM